MKKAILVSACLLGTPCRYDGKSKADPRVLSLSEKFDLIPFCPEVSGGLSTPRLPCEICGGRVIRQDGEDLTASYCRGAELALAAYRQNACTAAILKSKSPSCGKGAVYDGTFSRKLINGNVICAALFMKNGIPVYTEEETEELIKEERL